MLFASLYMHQKLAAPITAHLPSQSTSYHCLLRAHSLSSRLAKAPFGVRQRCTRDLRTSKGDLPECRYQSEPNLHPSGVGVEGCAHDFYPGSQLSPRETGVWGHHSFLKPNHKIFEILGSRIRCRGPWASTKASRHQSVPRMSGQEEPGREHVGSPQWCTPDMHVGVQVWKWSRLKVQWGF